MRRLDLITIVAILLLGALYGYVGQEDQQSAAREKIIHNMQS